MAIKQITIHRLEIEDKPGSLQKLLADAASVGVDLQCFAAFSAGGGRVYVSAKSEEAFKALGLEATAAAGFIVSGDDRVGAAAEALKGLAEAGINGVAGSAIACGGQYCMLIVVDAADEAAAGKALGV